MTWNGDIAALRSAVDTSYAVLARTPHEALLWLTTVIAVFIVCLDDDISDAVREAVDDYHAARPGVFRRSGRTYRSPRGWTRWTGVIEMDLINPTIARKLSPTKADLLAELGVDVTALAPDQRIIVLHEHAVIDHRGHPSADALLRDIRTAWPGARRVHSKRLHTEGTIAENLGRLASYGTKFVMRYSVSWNGRKTSYLSDYEREWRDYMCRLYQQIGVARLLNANITTQASNGSGTREMHTASPVLRAETDEGGRFQLSPPEGLQDGCDDYETDKGFKDTTATVHDTKETEGMRAHEIIDGYVDPETITKDALGELERALARQGPGLSPEEIAIMYGDEERDLRLEQQRLDADKTRAEIARLRAAAARDRAEAARSSGW